MKHPLLFVCMAVLMISSPVGAQEMEQVTLGNASGEGEMLVFHPTTGAKPYPAIIICPGGGYHDLAMDYEGTDMAQWFAKQGFVAAVLKYSMPNGKHGLPLSDAQKAISIMRATAPKWGVDKNKVGVAGSSAGGHLAASLSTLAIDVNRPNFAILFYPLIHFDQVASTYECWKNLLGTDVIEVSKTDRYSLDKQVDQKTPPTLIFLADDDLVVIPMHSNMYYTALKEREVPAAMYIFPEGGHGFGFKTDFAYHNEMKTLIMKWLKGRKIIH